mgnify:CR=1 FL=1
MKPNLVVAIDGPSGAGKSTVAHGVAQAAGLQSLDTGAMYRAFAIFLRDEGLTLDEPDAVAEVAERVVIDFDPARPDRVRVSGRDVADEIRNLEVGQMASQASTHSAVRRRLVTLQQAIIAQGRWILEGRDVTTVVAPQADLKIFLTASIEERARRRWLYMQDRGQDLRLQDVVRDVVERDHRDYTRADSPLSLAEDAEIIETFGVNPTHVVAQIAARVETLDRGEGKA